MRLHQVNLFYRMWICLWRQQRYDIVREIFFHDAIAPGSIIKKERSYSYFTMNEQYLRNLLFQLQQGTTDIDDIIIQLRQFPLTVLEEAQLDYHRLLRTGIPEVVFGENKTTEQLLAILENMLEKPAGVLATRISKEKADKICPVLSDITYHPTARMLTGNDAHIPQACARGNVIITTAGTSDIPVAEEAKLTLTFLGHPVETIYDAGVAGIHRILSQINVLQQATVIIVVAGMEGALPSVVAGITPAPVIGVPTSIGYGTGAGGFSALLGMLNSCSPGLAVVNIDNGFGAACMAAAINKGT
jgi:NCAIR mutase (PurE)-related protein